MLTATREDRITRSVHPAARRPAGNLAGVREVKRSMSVRWIIFLGLAVIGIVSAVENAPWLSANLPIYVQKVQLALQPSPAPRADFSLNDLPTIKQTSRREDLRFQRDYKGKTFEATMSFSSADTFLGQLMAYLDDPHSTGLGSDVHCEMIDTPATRDFLIDLHRGDKVHIRGYIHDTVMGTLILNSCSIMHDRSR
jgi:hypothetical protein